MSSVKQKEKRVKGKPLCNQLLIDFPFTKKVVREYGRRLRPAIMWFCDRSLESSGLIPEGFLELDDLVKAGNRVDLIEILVKLTFAFPASFRLSSQEIAGNEAAVRTWHDSLETWQMADCIWSVAKTLQDQMWQYIPRSGKYSHIFFQNTAPTAARGNVRIWIKSIDD